jgi:hypothetical protein
MSGFFCAYVVLCRYRPCDGPVEKVLQMQINKISKHENGWPWTALFCIATGEEDGRLLEVEITEKGKE